jgi:predicted transcriptional regulator
MKNMIDKKAPYVLKEIGEIKTQLFEITEKGKQLLEKLK